MEHSLSKLGRIDAARSHLGLAVEIAHDAGQHLRTRFVESQSVRTATGRDIKIEADYLLDRFIVERLRAATSFPILSEESGGALGVDECWIVDPLDGSFNFARSLPFSAISIALWHGGRPVAGVVHDFGRGECFSGLIGDGAWLNGNAICPSSVGERAQAVLCTGIPIQNPFGRQAADIFSARLRSFKKVRMLGSAALMLAYVACGRADLYREDSIALWDVAAGLAIVQAAGGRIRWRASDVGDSLDVEAANGALPLNDEGSLP